MVTLKLHLQLITFDPLFPFLIFKSFIIREMSIFYNASKIMKLVLLILQKDATESVLSKFKSIR